MVDRLFKRKKQNVNHSNKHMLDENEDLYTMISAWDLRRKLKIMRQ